MKTLLWFMVAGALALGAATAAPAAEIGERSLAEQADLKKALLGG